MALATLNDVKRVGQISSDTNDQDLTAALAAAESWMRKYLRYDPDASGAKTTIKHDVREDDWIPLPDNASAVTAVRAALDNGSGARVLTTSEYEVESRGVRLRPYMFTQPFEGATGQRLSVIYDRVEVDWTSTAGVPAAVRDATALLAIEFFRIGPSLGESGYSERIGDYSYTSSPDSTPSDVSAVPAKILAMARPFRRRRSLVP